MLGGGQSLSYPSPSGLMHPYREPRAPRFSANITGPLELVTAGDYSGLVAAWLPSAKAQVSCTDFTDFDAFISDLLLNAIDFCETAITGHRQFVTATYDIPVTCWWAGALTISRPPLQSVVSVTYYDPNGVVQTLDPSLYVVQTPWRGPGLIERAPLQVWPSHQVDRRYPITVRVTCGYMSPSLIPPTIKHAVMLIVGHSYRFRGDDDESGRTSDLEIPPAALACLEKNEWALTVEALMPNSSQIHPIACYDLSAQIANGGTTSAQINLSGCVLVGLFMPATFTGTAVSFLVSATLGGTDVTLTKDDGSTYAPTVAAGRYVALNPSTMAGIQFIKIVSNATEAQADTIILATRPV